MPSNTGPASRPNDPTSVMALSADSALLLAEALLPTLVAQLAPTITDLLP